MLKRIAARILAIAALTLGGVAIASSPALAAGGGCTTHPGTEPCISKVGSYVYGDFYQIRALDSSMDSYVFYIVKNGEICHNSLRKKLTHTGHYDQERCSVTGHGSAYSEIFVYTSNGTLHYSLKSPTVTW